jgi:hypothetical protein
MNASPVERRPISIRKGKDASIHVFGVALAKEGDALVNVAASEYISH